MTKIILTALAISGLAGSLFVFAKQTPVVVKPVVAPSSVSKTTAIKKAPIAKPKVVKPVVKKPLVKKAAVVPPKKIIIPKRPPIVVTLEVPIEEPKTAPVVAEKSEPFTTSDGKASQTPLSIEGVLRWSNQARQDNGAIPAVKGSASLNAIAALRLKEMFDLQYFAHNSPSGISPSEVATNHGYDFITFGENIAMGTYADDQDLVDAWMHSPLHRDNILNPHYHELGIAVGKGLYQGRETWIAVQNFGTPASVCPEPDAAVKTKIDSLSKEINTQQAVADLLRVELNGTEPTTKAEVDAYNTKVAKYNALVTKINALNTDLKKVIKTYNDQVKARNQCIKA